MTYRMHLTYSPETKLHFRKEQIVALAALFVLGCGCVMGYLTYHYSTTSITTGYTTQERVAKGKQLYDIICQHEEEADDAPAVAIIDSAYKPFLSNEVTYNVSFYAVSPEAEDVDALWTLKKTPASKHKDLSKQATAIIVMNDKTGELLSYSFSPAQNKE